MQFVEINDGFALHVEDENGVKIEKAEKIQKLDSRLTWRCRFDM